jgi:hypothetical protein
MPTKGLARKEIVAGAESSSGHASRRISAWSGLLSAQAARLRPAPCHVVVDSRLLLSNSVLRVEPMYPSTLGAVGGPATLPSPSAPGSAVRSMGRHRRDVLGPGISSFEPLVFGILMCINHESRTPIPGGKCDRWRPTEAHVFPSE